MKIYVGADHQGYALKEQLVRYLSQAGYEVEDQGDKQFDSEDDFPLYAARVATSILSSEDQDPRGILLCGSGQGMVMAANRYRGIRAALCWDQQSARESRNDDDSNILCLPAKQLDHHEASVLIEVWLNTRFAGAARFSRRIKQIDEL